MKPNISHLIRAQAALKASEDAERAGDMDAAIAHAVEALEHSEAWQMEIIGARADKAARAWGDFVIGAQKVVDKVD